MSKGFAIGDRALGAAGDTHPSWMMAYAEHGDYLIVGASAIGQIHQGRGIYRDDAFMVRSQGPWLAVAVSDGVGSRPCSRYGSSYAVESITSQLLRQLAPLPRARPGDAAESAAGGFTINAPPALAEEIDFDPRVFGKIDQKALEGGFELWSQNASKSQDVPLKRLPPEIFRQATSTAWEIRDQPSAAARPQDQPDGEAPLPDAGKKPDPGLDLGKIVSEAFEKTHLGLQFHARQLELEPADLGCTALAVLINCETGQSAAGQVGDGAIIGLSAGGEAKELVIPQDTEDPQRTYTINRQNFKDHLVISQVENPAGDPLRAFFVMTDGLSGDLLYSADLSALSTWAQKVESNVSRAASPAQAAAGMLNWLATYQVRGSWDDRTLVVITQRERTHDRG